MNQTGRLGSDCGERQGDRYRSRRTKTADKAHRQRSQSRSLRTFAPVNEREQPEFNRTNLSGARFARNPNELQSRLDSRSLCLTRRRVRTDVQAADLWNRDDVSIGR
jgi:hypothetical protein